jgi:hypothetical protein
VEALAVLAAIAVVAFGSTLLVRHGRAGTDVALDRTAQERIARRIAEIPRAREPGVVRTAATHHQGDPESGLIRSRRLLLRDTFAALTVLGLALIAVLVIDLPGPTGSVLEATGTPQPPFADAIPDATLVAKPGTSMRPAAPPASLTPGPAASALPPAAEPLVTPALGPAVASPTTRARPTSDRMALLTPCPDEPDCYIYIVRRGDNVESIANWFGIPYATVLALNPQIRDPGKVRAGDRITLPTPRR